MAQTSSRREIVRAETFEKILAIAREEMKRDGVAALSLGAIARRLGMRTPSLYTYIDGKNDIYDALFARGFVEFGRWMDERPRGESGLRETLISALETYLRFAQENPDLYQLMFQRPVPEFVPSAESMAISLARLDAVREEFTRLVGRGEVETGLPFEEARDLFIAMQHGLTALHMANNPELPVGQGRFGALIPQAVDLFVAAWQKGRGEVESGDG